MPGTEAAHEWLWGFEGTTLELTENYETRNDPNFKYNNGNVEPHRGFGHIAMMVWLASCPCLLYTPQLCEVPTAGLLSVRMDAAGGAMTDATRTPGR
jgi:hypothetical protein